MNVSIPTRSSHSSWLFAFSLGAAFLVSGQRARGAALWEAPGWAVLAAADAQIVYDNNVFIRRGGEGDTLFTLQPHLKLQRVGSLTDFQVEAAARVNRFFDFSSEDSIDPRLTIYLKRPSDDLELPTQEVAFAWARQTEPDPDVGERIRRTSLSGGWEGQIYSTGKTFLSGSARGSRVESDIYDSVDKVLRFGLGVGYSPRDLLRFGLSYSFENDDYQGRLASSAQQFERDSHEFSLGVRGELTPKISGRAALGFAHTKVSGDMTASNWDWTASGNLTWTPVERRHVALTFRRSTYFTVDGRLVVTTRGGLELRQSIAGGFTVSVRASATKVDRQVGDGDDYDTLGVGISGQYAFTGRLTAEVGGELITYASDTAAYDFNQQRFFAGTSYRF